jgi:predicted nuclease with TOPRIM domain
MNLNSTEDFEFNCVLIYYRIRKGDSSWQTNLYGVLFLEEVSTSDYNTNVNNDNERGGYIQRYPKFKKGNSWGLKLDLKIDAQPDSQMELRDKLYDDPNEGTSMQMFSEALMRLNDCSNLFYDIKKENTYIEERLYNLENIVSGIDTVYDLRNEVSVLRTKIEIFQPTLNSLSVDVEGLLNKISILENKFGSLIVDITNKNNKILNLENKISTLENKYSSLIDDITIKNNNINDRISDLESRLSEKPSIDL